jgi:hypothetical protein
MARRFDRRTASYSGKEAQEKGRVEKDYFLFNIPDGNFTPFRDKSKPSSLDYSSTARAAGNHFVSLTESERIRVIRLCGKS